MNANKPLLLMLPGLDGTGQLFSDILPLLVSEKIFEFSQNLEYSHKFDKKLHYI